MHFTRSAALALATVSLSSAQALDTSSSDAIKKSAGQVAEKIKSLYQNPDLGILPLDHWYWWESGSTQDGFINYYHITGDSQYNTLVASTIASQATGTNDFMTADASGNDDQGWWALAAMSAAEYDLPASGGTPWLKLAQNVFDEQRDRWDNTTCNGGLKWKIKQGDSGYDYKSTISNGLFFQLAARLGRYTGDAETLSWAEKAYNWTATVGLIDTDFNVYDGTDDSKGCVGLDKDQWSYNTGVFLYGAAVMAAKTGDDTWAKRAEGLIKGAKANFVKDGNLWEKQCEADNIVDSKCNTDQQSFKATLARWMGAAATVQPDLASEVKDVLGTAATAVGKAWGANWSPGEHLGALETLDAALCTGEKDGPGQPGAQNGTKGGSKTRSVAGRIKLEALF